MQNGEFFRGDVKALRHALRAFVKTIRNSVSTSERSERLHVLTSSRISTQTHDSLFAAFFARQIPVAQPHHVQCRRHFPSVGIAPIP